MTHLRLYHAILLHVLLQSASGFVCFSPAMTTAQGLLPLYVETDEPATGWKRRALTASSSDDELPLNSEISTEDPILLLPIWKSQLQALKSASGSTASSAQRKELQAKIDQACTAAEFGIRRVQLEFYEAFSTQNFEKMASVWSDDDEDCECVHPGMSSIQGKRGIMASWAIIFQNPRFHVEPTRTKMEISGPTAICRCVEKVGGDDMNTPPEERNYLEAINIYRRENGEWKMTMHMATPVAVLPSSQPPLS